MRDKKEALAFYASQFLRSCIFHKFFINQKLTSLFISVYAEGTDCSRPVKQQKLNALFYY